MICTQRPWEEVRPPSDCRFPGAPDDCPPASDGLFHSESRLQRISSSSAGRFEPVLLFHSRDPALAHFPSCAVQMELMLICLFLFNVVRGISTGAWLPWLTGLVPANARELLFSVPTNSYAMRRDARYRDRDARALVWRPTLAIFPPLCH